MDDAYIEQILSECGGAPYPDAFLAQYEPMECLAQNNTGATLLVRNKQTGVFFVAKCYTDKTLLSHITEAGILKALSHPGLPKFAGEFENDRMLCVVREYITGMPLDQVAAKHKISEANAVGFAEALCDILIYLHSQNPGVIHRDIKPQNLIVDKNGNLRLIDFGISRVYDSDASEDTVCYGTRYFAAPEQYGFAQTDMRTDIFSLGVLLGWMLTEEYELNNIYQKISNRHLLKVVKRCTAFAPEKRFSSADKVKRALRNSDGHRQKSLRRWICGAAACAVCLCLGFALGRYTDISPALAGAAGVRFEEPLIEQAVRLTLGKDEDAIIDEKELLSITEIYIYGDHVVADPADFEELNNHFANNDGIIKNGGIVSLDDLSKFDNLKIMRIAFEHITDLSPLSGLMGLEQVDLRQNPVEDLSPLASSPALRNLILFETHVSDFTSLSGCLMLEHIDAGKTYVTSPAAFRGIDSLKTLGLEYSPIQTLNGFKAFSRLEEISLSDVADSDLSPLLELPALKRVSLNEALRDEAERDLIGAAFTIDYP